MSQIIIDAGPLVALIHRDDQYHVWAKKLAAQLSPPFLACESVLSEAHFILRHLPVAQQAIRQMLTSGLLESRFELRPETGAVVELMDRYADVPMSVADACLVRMSELLPTSIVFTTDSDFNIYRRHRHQPIPLISPPLT